LIILNMLMLDVWMGWRQWMLVV